MCYDWSTWDDAYAFVEDKNDEFIQTNLQYESFKDININFILFYNQSSDLVFSKVFDFNQEKEIALPDSFYRFIDDNEEILLHHANYSHSHFGAVLYDQKEEPLLITATPIVKSNKEGPIRGTMIQGRFIDRERIDYFENITQLSIEISPLSG